MVEEEHACYAWALMLNHLLIERGKKPISLLMSRLQTGYAGYFNRKYKRVGRLFQNRYKAILCDKDAYLLALVAYIYLNPLKGGRVKSLEELARYAWNGHRALMDCKKY
jgi:hypothetical protein